MAEETERVMSWCNWCQMIPIEDVGREPVDHGILCRECQKIVGTPEDYDREMQKDFDWSMY